MSWLWKSAYNCAVQGCSEWECDREQISELFDIVKEVTCSYVLGENPLTSFLPSAAVGRLSEVRSGPGPGLFCRTWPWPSMSGPQMQWPWPCFFYPINNTPVGGGAADNIEFKSRSRTNFTFPFTLSYNATGAQADTIISDLATKCGVRRWGDFIHRRYFG